MGSVDLAPVLMITRGMKIDGRKTLPGVPGVQTVIRIRKENEKGQEYRTSVLHSLQEDN